MSDFKAENPYKLPNGVCHKAFDEGAAAQLKKTVEWGDGPCPHTIIDNPGMGVGWVRRECEICWATLKKELGG